MEYTKFVDKLPIGTDSLREMVRTKISKTIQEKRPEEFQIGGTDGQARPVIAIDEINAEEISKLLLDVDHERADIDPYDEKILTDPNRGHWDLWTDGDADDGPVLDLSCQGYVARNPRADINQNRIVAIDFGTKSTVVVYQNEDSRILPVRVGTGNVSKSIRAEHYENPTIIEFNNLAVFMEAYGAALGRPATRWEDVYISHRAVDDLQSSRSTDYSAFFTELKQWAGDAGVKKSLRFRDRESNDYLIKPFHELSDTDLNPIELYAYYLGLYINNMRNGIFFNYYLSFPVTYEISVREKIAKSFEKGIKKALPETLLKDEAVMKNFKINGSISEPAAYAVCALQEYGFEPMDDEVIFYSVFDFGGGTTDFDFGEWRESDSPKYDYTVEHFGASGDRYLGGENILAELAFYIFRKNEDKLREENITFNRPLMCPDFAGSETLISDSREANINMHNLTDKLRPVWENTGEETVDESGSIKVNLFRNDGSEVVGMALDADLDELNDLIYQRIEKGIESFFTSLITAFGRQYLADGIQRIYIILAGNSSKSQYVEEIFSKKIISYTRELKRSDKVSMFELLPPIGTEAFAQKRAEINPEAAERPDDRGEFERPSGKTGVAFGLIECRRGGRIEIIERDEAGGEIPFKYYLGTCRKRCFKSLDQSGRSSKIPGRVDYGKWYEVFESDDYTIELYYTTEPDALTNRMPIENARKLVLHTDADNKLVFIRAADPHTLEYISAENADAVKNGNYIGMIHRISLE